MQKVIGEGSYAKVYLGKSILCDKCVAIKCYERTILKTEQNWERLL